jgi:hypothetical protein
MSLDLALLLVICIAGWLRMKWEKRQDDLNRRSKQIWGDWA